MNQDNLTTAINSSLNLALPPGLSYDELKEILASHINELILKNFEQLINLLYRIDISEAKLKWLLQEQPQAKAGEIIAAMIIERQLEKIEMRKHSRQDNDIPDAEKW